MVETGHQQTERYEGRYRKKKTPLMQRRRERYTYTIEYKDIRKVEKFSEQ